MVDLRTLGMADPMGVMTGIAGGLKVTDVLVMIVKRFIIQDAGTAVAVVA
jgi:hypothetical protein